MLLTTQFKNKTRQRGAIYIHSATGRFGRNFSTIPQHSIHWKKLLKSVH